MTLEEAIQTAIAFEKKVVASYRKAEAAAEDAVGKRVFGALTREEEDHVSYLESRLAQWRGTGRLSVEALETVVPPRAVIAAEVAKLDKDLGARDHGGEVELLQKALKVEAEATRFYERMVEDLPEEGKELFRRFLEIEEGHLAIVQAEIDSVSHSGVWFDFLEFQM